MSSSHQLIDGTPGFRGDERSASTVDCQKFSRFFFNISPRLKKVDMDPTDV